MRHNFLTTSELRPLCRLRTGKQGGQALVELSIVILMLVTLAMGTIEFGRAWMVANMITHAARDGARTAAVVPGSNRDGSGNIIDTSAIVTAVRNEIRSVLDAATTDALTIAVSQTTAGGIPTVQVTVNGTVPYVFNLVGTSFTVNRAVTFRDEGR